MNDITEQAGSLIVQDGEILLVYKTSKQHWDVPGKRVEDSESPTEAAVNAVEEQIGVKAGLEKPFYTGEFQEEGEIFLWNGYIAEIEEGEPEKLEGVEEIKWFNGSELDSLDLSPNLNMILPALRKL